MAALHWAGKLHPIGTDINHMPRNCHGRPLLRPLYGGSDAPARCRITISRRMGSRGLAQLKIDVCMFAKNDRRGALAAYVLCRLGDILSTGT